MVRQLAIVFAFTAAASAASAQPPAGMRVTGVVTAITPTSFTVKTADGATTVLTLPPTAVVVKTHPVDIDAIKPGSFVATANTNIDLTSGRSIELRMFEPGAHVGEGSRPMPAPNTTMTNGTVETIAKGKDGRELDVSYPGGTRHIIVPSNVQVIGAFPADRDDLKPGVTVTTFAAKSADGTSVAGRVSIAEAQP